MRAESPAFVFAQASSLTRTRGCVCPEAVALSSSQGIDFVARFAPDARATLLTRLRDRNDGERGSGWGEAAGRWFSFAVATASGDAVPASTRSRNAVSLIALVWVWR